MAISASLGALTVFYVTGSPVLPQIAILRPMAIQTAAVAEAGPQRPMGETDFGGTPSAESEAALSETRATGRPPEPTVAPAQPEPKETAQVLATATQAAPASSADRASSSPEPDTAPAAQPAASSWTTTASHGAWQVRCRSEEDSRPGLCTAVLEMLESESRRPLLLWIVGAPQRGAPLQTVFQTPTGMLVSAGVGVRIGETFRNVDYVGCVPQQCTAAVKMDDSFVNDTLGAEKVTVILYTMDGKRLDLGVPVEGFDKALADIRN